MTSLNPIRLVLLAVLAVTGGCGAVLTKPQVDAVNAFATASGAYSTLPGSVLRSYAALKMAGAVLDSAAVEAASLKESLKHLKRGIDFGDALEIQAVKVDAALGVLTQYSRLLRELSSDAVLDNLDAAASTLGGAIDQSISLYNRVNPADASTTQLPTFGSSVAAGVRAAGGVIVRYRQAMYLRKFVSGAEGPIEVVAKKLTALLDDLYDPAHPEAGDFVAEAQDLERTYVTYFTLQKSVLRAPDVQMYFQALRMERAGVSLTTSTLAATAALVTAHKAILASLKPEASMSSGKAEIEALTAEIQAGSRIKDRLDNQSKCAAPAAP